MIIKQLSVFLENKKGRLAAVMSELAGHNIDVSALSLADTTDFGVLRLIVDDSEKATGVLLGEGFILNMTPVTVVVVPDEAGGLASVLDVLAEGGIDVDYMYSMFPHADGKACMVFRLKDENAFVSRLASHDLHVATKTEPGLK